MRLRVLGGLVVEGTDARALGSRKARTLLKVLALARGRPVPVDVLADVLWGDAPPARPGDQIGVLASRIRRALGPEEVVRHDGGLAARVDWLDLDELLDRTAAATAALTEGRAVAAAAAADAALALARGPVLPDDDGEWVRADRRAAERALAIVGVTAAEAALAAGDPGRAAVVAAQALARDPVDEAALRALMRAHLACGRPGSALAAYSEVRVRLADDLGVSPTAETEALHEQVLLADPAEATSSTAPAAPPAAAAPSDLIGRDDEVAAIESVVARVRAEGGATCLCVVGEAGIGKTALVDEVARRAAAAGALVLRARCDELERDLPLQPIVDALTEATAAAAATATGPGGPVRGTPVRSGAATVLADGETGRARLFAELRGEVEALAGGRLAVVVVDDLHRASPATVAWLGDVGTRGRGVVVLATARHAAPLPPGATVVELAPLGESDARRLMGGDAPDDAVRRADGNPLFLLALAGAGPGPPPESVASLARAQVDDLGPTAATTLRTAACLGSVVDLDLIAAVVERPAVDVLAELDAARAAGLLVERGVALEFRHELVREALDHQAGAVRRAFAHRQAARALRGRPAVDPLVVAVHARLGGDRETAAEGFVRAAEVAVARHDLDAAIGHLEASLAQLPSTTTHVALARVRMAALDLEGAAADAAAARALDGGPEALEVTAWVAYYRRAYDEAVLAADEGARRAAGDRDLEASCRAVAGRVRHGRGDLVGADRALSRGPQAAPPVQGVLDVWLAHLRVHQGRPVEAIRLVDRALLDDRRLAHPWAPLHGRFARIMALGHAGRPGEALAACDELDEAAVRAGALGERMVPVASNVRGWLHRTCGDPDRGEELAAAARAATAGPGGTAPAADRLAEAFWVGNLDAAEAALEGGDDATAAEWVARAAPLDTWEGTMAWHQRHRLAVLRSRLCLRDGDRGRAAALAGAVADDAAARGARRGWAIATAWCALAGGQAPVEEVVRTLGEAAALEGWPLVGALAEATGSDALRREAERRAAALVDAAGPLAEPLRRRVARELGSP